jgi:uracil-DNA glycosylase family 4
VPLAGYETGRRFDAFLAVGELRREEVFVTNAVLCNPLDADGRNRTPTRAEVAKCLPYLTRTLELVAAPVVVTLGRVALEAVRAIEAHDLDLARDVAMPTGWRGRTLFCLYHPGRQATLHRMEAEQVADWRALGAFIRGADARLSQDSGRR